LADANEEDSALLLSGQAHAMHGNRDDAIDALSTLCANHPSHELNAIWYSLIASNMDRLDRFVDSDSWGGQIMRYLTSRISFDALEKLAAHEDNPPICIGDACCFAGLQYAQQGNQAKAHDYYGKCLTHSHFLANTYMWAEANLKHINPDYS